MTGEQGNTQPAFELADLVTYGAVSHAQCSGSGGKAQATGTLFKYPDGIEWWQFAHGASILGVKKTYSIMFKNSVI